MKIANAVLILCSSASVLGLSYRSRTEYAMQEEDATCVTPYRQEGKCIDWSGCQLILDLLECETEEALDYAHQSICTAGKFHAPVCCPDDDSGTIRTELCQSATTAIPDSTTEFTEEQNVA